MIKRFDIILSAKNLDFDEVPSNEGMYCFYEDVDKIFQEYEHDFNHFQEIIDELEARIYELESDRDHWKDLYNALYEQSC